MRFDIGPASTQEMEWAASLMSRSEPWATLGRGIELCREVFRRPEHLTFVARLGSEPVGFIVLQRRGVAGSPYIPSMGVDGRTRGQGVGAAMLRFAEEFFRPDSSHLFLCVSSFNERAQAFYTRHGFSEVGEFESYLIEGASEILMHKRLDRL